MRTALPLLFLLTIAASTDAAERLSSDLPQPPRRVKVLFLGDNGPHQPLERYRQIADVMNRRGVDLSYTDELSQITAENLKRFDVLMVYANIVAAPPEVEKTILDYVASGGGYAPIHCASYCWLNSEPLTSLTGARFQKHGVGVFKETYVQPDHPILKGLQPIESWDESYVHTMHNDKDRTVLSERVDASGKEPHTWVRTQGKGRIFYTAWGHDERTWGNKSFADLLERGLRWSAGDWALQPTPPLKPFEYGEGKAPNYLANKEWGTTGDVITKIQKPVSPEESAQHMVLPPGSSVHLFASEPQIYKPICAAWDERSRLWIAETVDYPNEMQEPGKGRDRIVILEDTDHDGRADKVTVFAEKLSIPTSLCFANGGVIVAQAPEMLFLKDTDGDDKADERKVLFTGWGTRDTHSGPSNMRYGFDNWIYGTVGYSGFDGRIDGKTLAFGQGLWRMKPDGSKLEFLGSTTNNTWGLGFAEDGNLFASTANNGASFYLHIPNRYYETVRGLNVRRLEPIDDLNKMFTSTDAVRQVDFHGGYTAGAGHALYTARTWPSYYWNRVAFVCEPTGHIIGQFLLQPDGSAFTSRNDASLLGSTDEWTSPIFADVGPDGQIWYIDWYNFIVQHNPIPQGFEKGKGNAYETPLRDKTHGRIYRLTYDAGTAAKPFDFSKATTEQLVEGLKHPTLLGRTHAQRLLVERRDDAAPPLLAELVKSAKPDAAGLNPAAVHALWTLKALNCLDSFVKSDGIGPGAAMAALKSDVPSVRKAAIDVWPRTPNTVNGLTGCVLDADPQVRKSALLALSEVATAGDDEQFVAESVYASAASPDAANDRWLTDAAIIAAANHDAAFLRATVSAKSPANARTKDGSAKNLVNNASFEDLGPAGKPKGWKVRHYSGEATEEVASDVGHSGGKSVLLQSSSGADTSWTIDVPCEPNTRYRLSGWIKTQDVRPVKDGLGALLNVHLAGFKTDPLVGTANWRQVSVSFNSGKLKTLSINCLFGGFGQATGAAWFDDIELTKVAGAEALPGAVANVLPAVVTHYAQGAPVESVVGMLKSLNAADPAVATLIVDTLAAAWPAGKSPAVSADDATALQSVMKSLPESARDRMLALASKWGRSDVFGDALAASVASLKAKVLDAKLSATDRAEAARRLIAVADNDDTAETVTQPIDVQAGPDVQRELLNAVATSRNASVGDLLVKKWLSLSPDAQRLAMSVLVRREPWSVALLKGIRGTTISAKDVSPQQWQTLTSHPDETIAKMAKQTQKNAGQTISADRQAIVKKLLPFTEKPGDAEKGKIVFQANCAVCHTIDGQGGHVGPELTGIGARPKADVLIDVLDPNRSVEGTFRQWTAQTEDDVITGRLLSESQTSVEIIDVAGTVHPIQRSQLKSLSASEKSVMPEGFEALAPTDIANLMEYLAASKAKH